MITMSDEPLITTGRAAKEVGYSDRSLLRWAKEGKITPARKTPGGHALWCLSDLRRQLAALEGHAEDDNPKG